MCKPTYCYNSSFLINENFLKETYEVFISSAFICLYQWCYNYQHFLTECLPKVFAFLYLKKKNNNLKIIIPNISWVEDFFLIFCDKNDIIKNSSNLIVENAYFASDKNRNMLFVDSFFYLMRDCISIHYKFEEKKENFYFKRINSSFNTSNNRNILNEEEFETFIKNCDYNIESFEYKDIYSKLKLLSKIKNGIFMNGATMMNFCFCNDEINLAIINNPGFFVDPKWVNQIYLNKNINYKIFDSKNIYSMKKYFDEPFYIDVDFFKNFLTFNKFI